MYVDAIRKVYIPNMWPTANIDEEQENARKAGFGVMSFNGIIWVFDKSTKKWVQTRFELNDFHVN